MAEENPQGLDANKIAAEVISGVVKDAAKAASAVVRNIAQKVINAITKDLNSYLTATIARCSRVKTILHREQPAVFSQLYVNQKLKCGNKFYRDDEITTLLLDLKSCIVEGTAGSGKSMFMRYLFLTLCQSSNGKIPLFIELRQLNTMQMKDLLTLVYHTIVISGVISQGQFNDGLKHGLFLIILDGFDEIDFDLRGAIEKQILDVRTRFPNLVMAISSRPDERFSAWSDFYVYSVLPMDKGQISALIRKVKYDADATDKFLKSLDGLFRTHSSFLSNPLLALMMLITFDQYAHIPDKLHIFYEHAFEALFSRHDSSKSGVFKRKTYTALPIDEFRNCLASFCMATYVKETFHFSGVEVRAFLKKAIEFEGLAKTSVDEFLSDLLESVCILQRDGLEIAFTHRSFQEYFSALFITRSVSDNVSGLLDQIIRRSEDHVVSMAFDMNKNLVETSWIIPRLNELNAKIAKLDLRKDLFEYLDIIYGGLTAQFTGKSEMQLFLDGGSKTGASPLVFGLYNLYPAAFSSIRDNSGKTKRNKNRDGKVVREIKAMLVQQKRLKNSHRPLTTRLRPRDLEWLTRTSHFEYFEGQKKALIALGEQLKVAKADREEVMEELFR